MLEDIEFLLVTCCLEQTRSSILEKVVANLTSQESRILERLTVLDNCSTDEKSLELLTNSFENVYRSDQNLGLWTAVNWWLGHIAPRCPSYAYIIESDMVHWDFEKIWRCAEFLKQRSDIGAVRTQEYSIKDQHLYNKDVPRVDSRRWAWQSGHNKISKEKIYFERSESHEDIYVTNFLTQLPALNRFTTMFDVFSKLRKLNMFSELDFQRLYYEAYKNNAMIDGGLYNSLAGYDSGVVASSWPNKTGALQFGYLETRRSFVLSADQYKITRL